MIPAQAAIRRALPTWRLVAVWVCLMLALSASRLVGQEEPFRLTGQIEAGDFRSVAVTDDGRLLVADGENRQVRVYNLSTEDAPEVIATLDMGGEPTLIAAAGEYAAVVTHTDQQTDLLQTMARSRYQRLGWQIVLELDIEPSPRALVISPDNRWGILIYDDGYTLLSFISSDNVGLNTFDDMILDAAFDDSNNVYLLTDAPSIIRATLSTGPSLSIEETLRLPQPATNLAVTDDATRGAVAFEDGTVSAFDPAAMALEDTINRRSRLAPQMEFFRLNDVPWLVLYRVGEEAVELVDFRSLDVLNTQPLAVNFELRALTTSGDRLIVSSSTSVNIFTP